MNARTIAQAAALVAVVVLVGIFVATMGCGKDEKAGMADPAMKAKSVNSVCPIMGMKFDPMTVPDNRLRDFNGMKVGFCSDDCPKEWDKLTDAEKQAKLDKVMPK